MADEASKIAQQSKDAALSLGVDLVGATYPMGSDQSQDLQGDFDKYIISFFPNINEYIQNATCIVGHAPHLANAVFNILATIQVERRAKSVLLWHDLDLHHHSPEIMRQWCTKASSVFSLSQKAFDKVQLLNTPGQSYQFFLPTLSEETNPSEQKSKLQDTSTCEPVQDKRLKRQPTNPHELLHALLGNTRIYKSIQFKER